MRVVNCAVLCAAAAIAGCQRHGRHLALADVHTPRSPHVERSRWETIGRTLEGRAVEAMTIGIGPRRIYLIGGIHGNEPEGLEAAEILATRGGRDLAGVTLRLVKDANPDGTARRARVNGRGNDLNRNWPAANFASSRGRGETPLSEPETQALHRDILSFNPDVIVVFHSIASGPFVNFDGPAEELAESFATAARRVDERWKVVRNMGYGTPGSMGSYFGVDRGVPILTVEFRRGQESRTSTPAAIAGVHAVSATVRGVTGTSKAEDASSQLSP